MLDQFLATMYQIKLYTILILNKTQIVATNFKNKTDIRQFKNYILYTLECEKMFNENLKLNSEPAHNKLNIKNM